MFCKLDDRYLAMNGDFARNVIFVYSFEADCIDLSKLSIRSVPYSDVQLNGDYIYRRSDEFDWSTQEVM